MPIPVPMRRCAVSLLVSIVAVLACFPTAASAQAVRVPTFLVSDVAGSFRQSTIESLDVAVGRDGNIAFVWDDISHSTPRYTAQWSTQIASPAGAMLGPEHIGSALGFESVKLRLAAPLFPPFGAFPFSGYAVVGNLASSPTARLALDGTIQSGFGAPGIAIGAQNTWGAVVAVKATDDPVYAVWSFSDDGITVVDPDAAAPLNRFTIAPVDPNPNLSVTPLADGGYLVVFGAHVGTQPPSQSLLVNGEGIYGALATVSVDTVVEAVAVAPEDGRLAMVGTRPRGAAAPNEIWALRMLPDGTPDGAEWLVYAAAPGVAVVPDVEIDKRGNLYVVWTEGGAAVKARAFDGNDVPQGPAVTLGSGPARPRVRTARLLDGGMVNAWVGLDGTRAVGNIVSLCLPTTVCGDGLTDAYCEACDDPLGNSDTIPDRCRTNCELPRCNDGTKDSTEECDDGNGADCDGCSAHCTVETGLGCGDGVAYPTCGEPCDDGNVVEGDGCSNDCRLELAPGGGSQRTDCFTSWSIDNPANEPRFDKRGAVSVRQACVDDDPRCDFDGGVPGGCTFHVRVCVNTHELEACTATTRVATWSVTAPSATRALHDPVAGALRSALLMGVPSVVVGSAVPDLCSPTVDVRVPLPDATKIGKTTIKTVSKLYTGQIDKDRLDLRCLPAAP